MTKKLFQTLFVAAMLCPSVVQAEELCTENEAWDFCRKLCPKVLKHPDAYSTKCYYGDQPVVTPQKSPLDKYVSQTLKCDCSYP